MSSKRRLRIFDLATPWFWVVVFWTGRLEAHAYDGPSWTRGWFHFWQWEDVPDQRGAEVVPLGSPETRETE